MATPKITPTAISGYSYPVTQDRSLSIQVISGTPVMTYSKDNWITEATIDLTASATYPNAIVDLPECHYKITGGVVKVS